MFKTDNYDGVQNRACEIYRKSGGQVSNDEMTTVYSLVIELGCEPGWKNFVTKCVKHHNIQ